MKIGIIVSTYNRPDTLVKVLNGLFCQTRAADEIIIADDGSGSDTREALAPFLDNPEIRCTHVWQEDKGFRLARVRNQAIKAALSDYLVFLDGDCIPQPTFTADHLALAQEGYFFQGKRVIVSREASPEFTFEDTRSFAVRFGHLVRGGLSNGHHIFRLPFWPAHTTSKRSGVRGCNMGFFKKDLLAVNGFNQAFKGWGREDSEIVVRLYKYGLRRKEHPFKAICYHLWHREYPREQIGENDRLLEQAAASQGYYCRQGIRQEDETKT